MSQIWDVDLISPTGTSPSADIQRIIDGFNTLRSTWSGATEPALADRVAYMLWADTTAGVLKLRNAANTAWITIGTLASTYLGNLCNSSVAKTANYTVVAADRGVLISCTNTITITFTAAATLGDGFASIVRNDGAGVVTLDPNSAELIDGQATIALIPGETAVVYCTGTALKTFNRFPPVIYRPDVVLVGGKITVTMAANAVTLAVKTDAGNDPSAAEPVRVCFRHATLTDGSAVTVVITAATSTVISSGSTGGTVSAVPSRVYVDVINNGGTVELAWHQTYSAGNLLGFSESALVSTTAEGGAGAADSAGVMYSTTARSNVAFRIAGYFESTQTTAGTWAAAATVVQQMVPGVKRTGDIVQTKALQTGAVATGTTQIPQDDTIPQNTEGTEFMSLAIIPSSALNVLDITTQFLGASSTGQFPIIALFQDAVASALAVGWNETGGSGGSPLVLALQHRMQAGTVSPTTFKIRVGGNAASTISFNGSSGARIFGGVFNSYLRAQETML